MIVVLGAFDGFHKAHRRLLAVAQHEADARKTGWGVVTFQNHPQTYLNDSRFQLLFSSEERRLLVAYWQIPFFAEIPFTETLAKMSPDKFIDYLQEQYEIEGVVVGSDFRFAQARTGTPQMLKEFCKAKGWSCHIVELIREKEQIISSSGIREAIQRGEIADANHFLGHPYFYSGTVVPGDKRGRCIGFPTANLAVPSVKIDPRLGVYASYTLTSYGGTLGATNIGYNPTFGSKEDLRFETHLLHFSKNLYGQKILVFLLDHIRSEKTFRSVEELSAQMQEDVDRITGQQSIYIGRKNALYSHFEKLFFSDPA